MANGLSIALFVAHQVRHDPRPLPRTDDDRPPVGRVKRARQARSKVAWRPAELR